MGYGIWGEKDHLRRGEEVGGARGDRQRSTASPTDQRIRFYYVTVPLTPALSRGRGRIVSRRWCKSAFIYGREAIGQREPNSELLWAKATGRSSRPMALPMGRNANCSPES